MVTAILDSNVLVQAGLSRRGASFKVVDAYLGGQFELVFSAETLNEVQDVLLLSTIQTRHGWSASEVIDFVTMLRRTPRSMWCGSPFRLNSRAICPMQSFCRWPPNLAQTTW